MTSTPFGIERRLGHYSQQHPGELLLVSAEIAGEWEQIAIYKGFASSLTRSTAFDPDVLVLPDDAVIHHIDRVVSPYDPQQPRYIQQGISWEKFQVLLTN